MLMNQREATVPDGVYCTLIGDMRKSGTFRSFQSDFIQMMPKDELISVTIKLQHNCLSDSRRYGGSFVPILHEYLLIWKKTAQTLFMASLGIAQEAQKAVARTWRSAIRMAMMQLGGQASLQDIYLEAEKVAGHLIQKNPHWQAKIRQTLQKHFQHVERWVWAV